MGSRADPQSVVSEELTLLGRCGSCCVIPATSIGRKLAHYPFAEFPAMRAALWSSSILASIFAVSACAATAVLAAPPYKVVKTAAVGGAGGFDYVFADADGR